jgi:hypothetical protein
MQTSVTLIVFLLPGMLVAYWVVGDWARERTMRRRWVAQRLLSDAIKRPDAPIVRRRSEVGE